jgi:hypothetical protein
MHSTTNSAVKMMMEATLENTATAPTARAPDTAPPDCSSVPVVHSVRMAAREGCVTVVLKAMWHKEPKSTGSSSVQVTRSRTGRPWWKSRISPPSSSAGAVSQ